MSKTPLVLLPGLFDDGQMWVHQCQHLSDIAEPAPVDLVDHETIGALADFVLENSPVSFALAGFSLGGYVAFEVWRRAPQRVSKLALIDTSARADSAEKTADRLRQIQLAQNGGYASLVNVGLPGAVHESRVNDQVLMSTLREMALRVGAQAFIRQQKAIMSRPDSRETLASIDCPTLVICGRQDTSTPVSLAEEMVQGIAGARLALVEDCSHYAPMERPYAVSALLRQWLLYG